MESSFARRFSFSDSSDASFIDENEMIKKQVASMGRELLSVSSLVSESVHQFFIIEGNVVFTKQLKQVL